MPDIVVSFTSHPEIHAGIEKGVKKLLGRCPWLRQERWSVDKLVVYAVGNKYEFPRYAQDRNGRSIILSGDIRPDDIEERAGGREGSSHFTEDSLLNSLFNLWLRKGKESLCGLNGRYSLITWDQKEQELDVATDAFGNRHIYYLQSNGQISLSTNLSILACSPHFKRTLDPLGIVESLRLGYQLEDRTLFSGIKIVPPSSLLVFKGGEPRFIENKRLAGSETRPDLAWKDTIEEMHFLLLDSLKKRARNDAEYIIPLSGGLDSRCVTGLSQELGLRFRCYTYGVKGCADIHIAPRVASAAGSTTEIALNKQDYILRRWGDPFLLNGDLRIPTISVFIDFLEYIGANKGTFISGFMGETITGSVYPFINRNNSFHPPDNFFPVNDLVSLLKMPGRHELAHEIPVTLTKMRDGFAGSDYVKDMMLDIVTRQRRYFSFQERLIEYYGGLIVPFEDVRVLEFFLKLPFMAMDNQELYRRFQVRYFPGLAKIPSVKYGALLPTVKSELASALLNKFQHLKRSLKIPLFPNTSRPVFAVDHGEALRRNGAELNAMILKYRDALSDIFDFGKIRELLDVHMRGDNSGTRKILAILLILSGLSVCRNEE
jgi:hypothetical protein